MNARTISSSCWKKAIHLLRELKKILAERRVQVAIASALLVACILSTGLGVFGLILGAVTGLALGIPLIPFTFGFSLPICSSMGAVIGFFIGAFLGWFMGLVIGGFLGHFGYANRDAIKSAAGCLVTTIHVWLTYEFGCAQAANMEEDHEVKGPLDAQTCSKEGLQHEEPDDGLRAIRACVENMTTSQAFSAAKMIVCASLIRIEKQRRSVCWKLACDIADKGTACSKKNGLEEGDCRLLDQDKDRHLSDFREKHNLSRHTSPGTFEVAMESVAMESIESSHVE